MWDRFFRRTQPKPVWQGPGLRLLTLIHISDLHFGYPTAEDGALPPACWKRHFKVFDGLLGHHFAALEHLTQSVNVLRAQGGTPLLVVTGDLTACGKAEEFDRARSFLKSYYDLGGPLYGLNEQDVFTRTIPGNHDHWPGTGEIKGQRIKAFDETFGAYPLPIFERQLSGGLVFQLFAINSDADVDPFGRHRRWARGNFVSQLTALETDPRVSEPTGNEIRVLLVHHSLAHTAYPLGICRESRRQLQAWIERAGISVVLTGHLHEGLGSVTQVTDRGTTWDLLEARCGTTTQLDRVPGPWRGKRTRNSDRLPLNSFLVHRLIKRDQTIYWEVEFLERLHDGFKERRLLPGLATKSIAVWPKRAS